MDALMPPGVDAYGVDPSDPAIESAVERGLDVRAESMLDHLEVVADEALSGLVLSGSVQWLHPNERDRLVKLAAAPAWPSTACWCSTRPHPSHGWRPRRTSSAIWPPVALSTPIPGATSSVSGIRSRITVTSRRRGPPARQGDRQSGCCEPSMRPSTWSTPLCWAPASTCWSPSGSGDRRPPVRPRPVAPGRHRRPHPGPARYPAPGRVGLGHLRRGRPRRAPARRHLFRALCRSGPSRATSSSTS
jgi:hypothetical protein